MDDYKRLIIAHLLYAINIDKLNKFLPLSLANFHKNALILIIFEMINQVTKNLL